MKSIVAAAVLGVCAMTFVGCASNSEEGVKSSYHSQWTSVNADTMTTTDAAKAVLSDRGLKDISGTATKVDGSAMGKKADGTAVKVAVEKQGSNMSQVSVTVGMMGDPALGAEIAKAIKVKAEGMNPNTMNDMKTDRNNMNR